MDILKWLSELIRRLMQQLPKKKLAWVTTIVLVFPLIVQSQALDEKDDVLYLSNKNVKIAFNSKTGTINYHFINGIILNNTVAYVDELKAGMIFTTSFSNHNYAIDEVKDTLGKGTIINFTHEDDKHSIKIIQHITLYENHSYVLISVEAESKDAITEIETRNISAIAILPSQNGFFKLPGKSPRLLDVPFDNDNWVNVLPLWWPSSTDAKPLSGIGYEFASVYDNDTLSGLVIGSVTHEFWKTGIRYKSGAVPGQLDSLLVYGGAAVPDNPALPQNYGGRDGTHDYMPHGTMKATRLQSQLVYLAGEEDVRLAYLEYGNVNASISGRLEWKGYAPFYWNSFGVEGVLGYEKKMMPMGVVKISDFIASLKNFNKYAQPVLSIDSYDQGIYTTEVLASIGKYGKKHGQQIGFYLSPFSVWNWKNAVETAKLNGTDYALKDVILRDNKNEPIPYKDGDWSCFPIDPTHPATRAYIVGQLQKAKAINAKFLKIDFLTAGSLESSVRYNPLVRTGIQAYTLGMKMFKGLVDSIMGPDIFISQAISPMFPSQYAHARFISTDVYSHLRNDQKGFPGWGSTESSLANGSHYWWMQGTLWPYTNMDISIMKNFQKNPDLNEQEIKVRLYSMMVMGSVLGDGSDYRDKLAAERAEKFLNNKDLCAFFSNPKVFTPLNFADGESYNQQLSFYLKGDTTMLGLFNFDTAKIYSPVFLRKNFSLSQGNYELREFLSGKILGAIAKGEESFSLSVPVKDAVLVKLIPVP